MSEINQAKFRNAIRKALEIQIFSLNFVPFVVSEECEQLTLMIICLISMGTLTLDAAYTICDSTSDLMIKAFPNNVKFLAFHTSSFVWNFESYKAYSCFHHRRTYSSSNAAALYPEERVTKINLVTLLTTQKIQWKQWYFTESCKTKLH